MSDQESSHRPTIVDRVRRALGIENNDRYHVSKLWAEDWDSPEDAVYDKPRPVPPAVFDAVCEALARTDLTQFKRTISDLGCQLIDRETMVSMFPDEIETEPEYLALCDDIDHLHGLLRDLVNEEKAWPVMPA